MNKAMRWSDWARGALCAAVAAFFAMGPGAQAQEAPALWRVSDADSTVWIFGSLHMLPPDLQWRGEALDQVIERADVVYFETDVAEDAYAKVAALMRQHGFNPPGVGLSQSLSPQGRELLARLAGVFGAPATTFEPMRPWLAYVVLETMWVERSGSYEESGVESVLHPLIEAQGTPIRKLETLEEQIAILSQLPEDQQLIALEETLRELDERPDAFEQLLSHWIRGDDEAMAQMVFEKEHIAPVFFERLIYARNANWAQELAAYVEEGQGEALVVVGAAHLVGPRGLPQMLRAYGLEVERR